MTQRERVRSRQPPPRRFGAGSPANAWAFAEGSTLDQFNEYLTLQNPGTSPVTVDLTYFTDGGAHPRKTLTLPAQTRTTVEVFSGDPTSSVSTCTPNGPGANCGVGRGIGGVAVVAQGENGGQFVPERVMYVNGFSFGSGPIADAHDAFGATSTPTLWYFAEGTTLSGFNEYLTLANLAGQPASADITYVTDGGQSIQRHITIPATSRYTVGVFDPTDGVGPGFVGVSAVVNTSFDVVATYCRAADLVGLEVEAILFVAAHAFDCVGAKACGMRTAFIDRRGRPFGQTPHRPDLVVPDFRSLAGALLQQPAG